MTGYGAFHVHKGPTLKDVHEFLAFLAEMTEEQFAHHVTGRQNDFAEWLEHVRGPGPLVQNVKEAKTKDELVEGMKTYVQDDFPTEDVTGTMEEEEFAEKTEEYMQRNDKIQDKFDELASSMQEALENPMPEELEKLEDDLKEQYEEIRAKISELRKKKKDMLIPALHLRTFPSKITYARASRERNDYEQARVVLQQVMFEIKEIEEEKEVDVKKEVLALANIDAKEYK